MGSRKKKDPKSAGPLSSRRQTVGSTVVNAPIKQSPTKSANSYHKPIMTSRYIQTEKTEKAPLTPIKKTKRTQTTASIKSPLTKNPAPIIDTTAIQVNKTSKTKLRGY